MSMTTKDAPDVTKVLHTAHRAYCRDTGCFDGDDISQPEVEAAVIEAIEEARRPLVEALRMVDRYFAAEICCDDDEGDRKIVTQHVHDALAAYGDEEAG